MDDESTNYLDYLNQGLTGAGRVLAAINPAKPPAAGGPSNIAPPTPVKPAWQQYLPWIIGGGLVLAVLGVLLARK